MAPELHTHNREWEHKHPFYADQREVHDVPSLGETEDPARGWLHDREGEQEAAGSTTTVALTTNGSTMPKVGLMLRHVSDPGGITVFTLNVVRRLVEELPGYEFHALYRSERQKELLSELELTHTILPSKSKLFWDQIAVPQYARARSLDVVFNGKLSVPLLSGKKTVFCLPGLEQFEVSEIFPLMDRAYTRVTMPLYCKNADAIITHTQTGKEHIVNHMDVNPQKVHVVPHGVHEWLERASCEDIDEIRKKYSLLGKYVLFLGGLNPLKNLRNLVRAFEIVAENDTNVQLALAGFKRWGHGPILKDIEESRHADRIRLLGFVPDEDLAALYSGAVCYVLPSWYEGFGIPILEAMACGTPVVTTERGCCPEVAGNAAILVDPAEPPSIARGILSFMTDPEKVRSHRERGLKRASEFTWRRTARGVAEVIDTLAR